MKKIFLLVAFFVLGKICLYAQYPLTQQLGSDSTIVISKGALQSRLINVTYTDTAAANLQRIRQYPAALIATTTGGLNLWVRNATATGWLPVATGSGNNIYTINGTLLGNRTLTGGGYPLTFTGLDKFVVSADSIRFTTGDLKFGLNTDSASLTKKISYSGNYRGDYKQFTLVDKGYVDSVVASSPAGTVTSIATNNGSGITGGTITSTGTLAIDTTNVISTKANVTSGLAGKLNISDTASMLAPYLRAIDTTSLSNRINLKLNISDTASMLGNYLNNVGYGLSKAGQVVSADSATLSNYYLRRKDSLTTTNPLGYVTKQILADTAAAIRSADAGGTVTSVGLTMPAAFNVGNSPITTAGTISVTAAGLVSQYIRGDGTLADFPGGGGGGGASISYYLNGSVNQGTFGGNTYYEMNKTPIFGTGTNFSINADGYIAQFITDAGDPGLLKIPGGNWNFELFFNASSGGGTPTYYVELYKYDGTTFTLIASGSSNPDVITGGTSVEAYFSTLPVPETVLTLTDRLAVRIYVTHAGRTITLHTEDNNLCQVITTFTTGITALNGLTEQVQYFATGTSGTDFNISSSVATHTFNLPTASATNRGALSTTDWTTFNNKVGGSLISGYIPKATGTNTIDTSQLFQNGQNVGIGTLTPNGRLAIVDTGGFALKINYNSASNVSDSNAAIYAENNGLSSYVAIFNEKTTNNTGAQLPLLIESSLTTGTPQANMGTGVDFGTRDDANNRKLNRFIIRGTDPAAATYTSRAEFRLWNNGVQTTPYYWLGNGNMGLGTSTPDSNLTVVNGAYFQRGIRASGLPAAPGTKALRIDASGTLSYADTLIDAGGTVTSVATNNGTGITGGTITTSGTLAIDTLLISTRAWRQKGVDSVISVMGSRVSGTTNYVSKFTGTNTIGNSQIFDNATSVGIGTAFPSASYKLDVNGNINVSNAVNYSQGGTKYGWTYATVGAMAMEGLQGADISLGTGSGAVATERMVIKNSGNVGIGITPDSMFTVAQGTHLQRGVRMSGLPTAVGTKSLRIDASGTVSVVDTGLYVPTSRTITINGTTQDLTADRTWNVGTVTTAAATGGGQVAFFNGSTVLTSISTLYFDGVNKLAIGNSSPDSMLSVTQGAHIQRGVRLSGLPTAPGTRALRVDANGTLSVSDTLTNGISGSGTTNYIPKFTSSSAIGNSIAYELNGNDFRIGNVANYRGLGILTQTASARPTLSFVNTNTAQYGSYIQDINGALAFGRMNYDFGGHSEAMRLDASGNLGLGISPSAWGSNYTALQLIYGSLGKYSAEAVFLSANAHATADGAWKYTANGQAGMYYQVGGQHIWYNAGTGTAGNAISFTQAMTLDASGNLGIGATNPSNLLHILSSAGVQSAIQIGQSARGTAVIGMQAAAAVPANMVIGTDVTGAILFKKGVTTTDLSTGTTQMTLDASGNLGLGVTPSAWSVYKSFDIETASLSAAGVQVEMVSNAYFNGSNWIYKSSTFPTRYVQNSGAAGGHSWFTAASGTAGNTISFTQAMTLDASGNLIVGGTTALGSTTNRGNITLNGTSSALYALGVSSTLKGFLYHGGTDMELQNSANGFLAFATNATERMRITSGGNVGIGTGATVLTPGGSRRGLQIGNGTNGALIAMGADASESNNPRIFSNQYDLGFAAGITTGVMDFYTNDVLRMRITSGGNVQVGQGVGNDAATRYLQVQGSGTIAGAVELINYWNGTAYTAGVYGGKGSNAAANLTFKVAFFNGSAAQQRDAMFIAESGNVGIGTTNPGARLDVNGNAIFGGSSTYNNVTINNNSSSGGGSLIVQTNGVSGGVVGTEGSWIGSTSTNLSIAAYGSPAAGNITFFTNGSSTERMRITSGGNVGINTQTPNATFHVNGSIASAISIKTATYTLTSSDYTVVFDLNGNATANLPNATTCSGRIYVIKINRTNVSDVLTIDPNGAQTIDGNATYDLQCQQAITIQSDGSNWRIIGDYAAGVNCL